MQLLNTMFSNAIYFECYSEILYGRDIVLSERRSQRKVKIRTKEREKQSIQLPKLQGFEE